MKPLTKTGSHINELAKLSFSHANFSHDRGEQKPMLYERVSYRSLFTGMMDTIIWGVMANDVYTIVHGGLSSLVSTRAATQVLSKALRTKGHTADTISREQMREVLLGPVFKELEGILPRDGVERNLKQILGELRSRTRPEPDLAVAEVATAKAAAEAAIAVMEPSDHEDSGFEALVPQVEGSLEEFAAEPVENALVENASVESEFTESELAQSIELEPLSIKRSLYKVADSDDLERLAITFAQLDHVKMVAGIRLNGEIVLSRGTGYDLNALARLGAIALMLLKQSGEMRSYYLAHESAQLFLFPMGEYALVIIGSEELNLGGVFAVLTALEEEK